MDDTGKCMVSSTAASITVAWDKQLAEESIHPFAIISYEIKFRVQGTSPFLATTMQIEKTVDEIEIKDLKSSTEYVINVFWCNEKAESKLLFTNECKTQDSKAIFLMENSYPDKTRQPCIYHLKPVYKIEHLVETRNATGDYADRIRVLDMSKFYFVSIIHHSTLFNC